MNAIIRRELSMYFKSPIGYVLLAIYALVSGLVFSLHLMNGQALLSQEFVFVQSLFFIIIPLLTMRAYAEERRNGTEILLMTSPASIRQIVWGKYIAHLMIFIFLSLITIVHFVLTLALGGVVDLPVLGAVVAYFLTGCAYISIGLFCSSLTENQIVAGVISMVIFLFFNLMSLLASFIGTLMSQVINRIDFLNWLSQADEQAVGLFLQKTINWLNPAEKTSAFYRGIFDPVPLVFLLTLCALFQFYTVKNLERRRYRQN